MSRTNTHAEELDAETLLEKVADNGSSAGDVIRPGDPSAGVLRLAPRFDWGMNDSEHFVQFYESDAFLLNSLHDFIGAGLDAGEVCIVVATKAHRDSLEEQLRKTGFDLAGAHASGSYVPLDAAETLSSLMLDGSPSPSLFNEIIGGIVGRALGDGRRVRIFGEMVELLWSQGNYDAAIQLEELWNDLQKTYLFRLFCAYPMHGFQGSALAERLGGVCASHGRVIPAESYTELPCADERLRAITLLQQKARSLEAEIAERKEAEEALRAVKEQLEMQIAREQLARAEAESACRLKDEFLATVSHELRTPLNAILGWSHMLRSGELDEATASRALETIERNAQSQAQLVEDLLDVSRVITGKLRLNISPVDIASVINAAIDAVQLAAESKGIQLEVRLDASARRVFGDSARLQQVIWNLLSNAIKFTPAGGRVELKLERAGSNARIKVSDTGQGFSTDFLPFIFDRFRQEDASSTRRYGGLGLGLAIVRHLVELHGGTVSAESAGEGKGATFIIKLPLAPARSDGRSRRKDAKTLRPMKDARTRAEPLPSLDDVRVLLVDDDRDTLNILAAVLMGQRATVQTASSVAEALEVLKWYKPDLLVSDLAMPDEDGYSLIGKVRELEAASGRQIPAVALTAYVRVEDRSRALSAGFNMFVPKPVEPGELVTVLAHLIEHDKTKVERA